MTKKPTRKDYMAHRVSFEEYYRSVYKAAGFKFSPSQQIVKDAAKALKDGDGHLNPIPLSIWDGMAERNKGALSRAFKEHDDSYSLGGGVCAIKQAVRDAAQSTLPLIRYCVTHMDRDGQRVLTGPCQARFTFGTEAEAQAHADAITANNSTSNLEQAYGPQAIGTFEVRPVECWRMADGRHGDPKRVYFDC